MSTTFDEMKSSEIVDVRDMMERIEELESSFEDHDDPAHCTSDDCPRFEVDFTMEQVGKVYLEGHDTDLVFVVRRRDDDLTPEQAEALILPLVYKDTNRPGAYFCHSVSAVQYPGRSNWCLVMVHRRSDT